MRIIFMGTPDFACSALDALIEAKNSEIIAVYTQAPKQAGRGHNITKTPVQILAQKHNIEVCHPSSLKNDLELEKFKSFKPDLVIVAAYGLIIPKAWLDICLFINIHASLLPRWRGAAPIQRAILAGDLESGISIMFMDQGLDTGAVLLEQAIAIEKDTDAGILHDRLASLGAKLCLQAIQKIANGDVKTTVQNSEFATYAKKINKNDAKLDFEQDVLELERFVRAFSPYPGAWFVHNGEIIKILKADYKLVKHDLEFGSINKENFAIAAKNGFLLPTLVQRQGRNIMEVKEFLKGYKL